MPDATNYLALLRERGILSWMDLGRRLFREVPKDEDGGLTPKQIRSYLQHSLGLTADRAGDLLTALEDIGIVQPLGESGSGEKRLSLHREAAEAADA